MKDFSVIGSQDNPVKFRDVPYGAYFTHNKSSMVVYKKVYSIGVYGTLSMENHSLHTTNLDTDCYVLEVKQPLVLEVK